MTILTLRSANSIVSANASVKGSPLLNTEVDNNFSNLSISLGVLGSLNTTAKNDAVSAINELYNDKSNIEINIGDLNDLLTTANSNLIAAINELYDKAGLDGTLSGVVISNSTWSGNLIAINRGGTNADTAANARVNLGLGTIATQNANNISITGGNISTSGNVSAGYFLGDGFNLSNIDIWGRSNSHTTSGSITLNANEPRLLSINIDNNFKSVTLPVLPETREGSDFFVIKNTGNCDFAVRNPSGNIIAKSTVGDTINFNLLDYSSNNWITYSSHNKEKLPFYNEAQVIENDPTYRIKSARLTDRKCIVIFRGSISANVNCVVVQDDLDGTVSYGSVVNLNSINVSTSVGNPFNIVAMSDTESILSYIEGSVLKTIQIGISGLTATVGSSPATVTSNSTQNHSIIKIDTNKCQIVYREILSPYNVYAKIVSLAAGVTSVGSPSAAIATSVSVNSRYLKQVALSTSLVALIYGNSSNQLWATTYSISGTTTTLNSPVVVDPDTDISGDANSTRENITIEYINGEILLFWGINRPAIMYSILNISGTDLSVKFISSIFEYDIENIRSFQLNNNKILLMYTDFDKYTDRAIMIAYRNGMIATEQISDYDLQMLNLAYVAGKHYTLLSPERLIKFHSATTNGYLGSTILEIPKNN